MEKDRLDEYFNQYNYNQVSTMTIRYEIDRCFHNLCVCKSEEHYFFFRGKVDALYEVKLIDCCVWCMLLDACEAVWAEKQKEKQPCESKELDDAISREVVLDEINRIGAGAFIDYSEYISLFDFVEKLPPVLQNHTRQKVRNE